MNLDEADKLARETDYADAATHQDDNPINWGDAAAFFLEGYEHAKKSLPMLLHLLTVYRDMSADRAEFDKRESLRFDVELELEALDTER